MNSRLHSIWICAAAMITGLQVAAADLAIVEDGKPAARIVISPEATITEKHAAEELRRAIHLMSGALLEISPAPASTGLTEIFIGTPASVEAVRAANLFSTGNEEETRVVARGSHLYLAGPTPRSALQATYTFLQDQMGARWFWPGDSGEYLPETKSIIVPDGMDLRHVPSLASRRLSINSPHYDEETALWMSRNRMNGHHLQTKIDPALLVAKGLQITIGGHNLILPKALLLEHPEYLAEFGGKRQIPAGPHPPHLCWSNQGVQDEVVSMIGGWWRGNPEVSSISIYGADHNHFCECSGCRAMAPDVSTRWQIFSAAVIQRLEAVFPGKKYQTLAYQEYRPVPARTAPFDLIGYTTYNIDYTKPLDHPHNERARAEILGWKNEGGRMGIRGYQFIPFNEPSYSPFASVIAAEIKWAAAHSLAGWSSEITPYNWPADPKLRSRNWITNRLPLYVAARMMWDSGTAPREIVEDWHRTIYGEAADAMEHYYWLMDDAWTSSPARLSYFLSPPSRFVEGFISTSLLDRADDLFFEARKAASIITTTPRKDRVRQQISLEEGMLDEWRILFLASQGNSDIHWVEVPEIAEKNPPTDSWWLTAAKLPPFTKAPDAPADTSTEGNAAWDGQNLHLRFQVQGSHLDAPLPPGSGRRDGDMGAEEVIEILLSSTADPYRLRRFAIGSSGARHDALVGEDQIADKSWDPEWTFRNEKASGTWTVEMMLPLAALGEAPGKGSAWRAAFRRIAPGGRIISGWPSPTVRNPSGFGHLELVENLSQKREVVIFEAGKKNGILKTELTKQGYSVTTTSQKENLSGQLAKDPAVLLLMRPGGWTLEEQFLTTEVRGYLDRGGMLIISGFRDIPLDHWFGPGAATKWSGWKIGPNRVTVESQTGAWQKEPESLESVIKNGVTPASGYFPLPGSDWESLASIKMADGRICPYLLRRKAGKGTIVLTTSGFSYSGGHEMFGNGHPRNAVKLLGNLLASHDR